MIKNSSKVTVVIGTIILLIAAILGITYVLTGETIPTTDGDKFGHPLKTLHTNKDSAPEILAPISMAVAMIGTLVVLIGTIFSGKGLTKVERSKNQSVFTILFIGALITMIAGVVLLVVAPKSSWKLEDYHGATIYWVVAIAMVAGAIMTLAGAIKVVTKKAPMISKANIETKEDEF